MRECHGDLHLGNMVLIDGRVRIFDCIEFSPVLRWIDVINETAFLAMDLLQRRRPDLAFRFLNRYLEVTGDYSGVRLLRYYMVYRALVRAKVALMRAAQHDVERAAIPALRAKCSAHLALAEQLIDAARPALVILHGLSGSGKTSVSQIVLESVGAIRIRSDIERKRLHGFSASARSGSAVGEGIYTEAAGAATYSRLAELASRVLEGDASGPGGCDVPGDSGSERASDPWRTSAGCPLPFCMSRRASSSCGVVSHGAPVTEQTHPKPRPPCSIDSCELKPRSAARSGPGLSTRNTWTSARSRSSRGSCCGGSRVGTRP